MAAKVGAIYYAILYMKWRRVRIRDAITLALNVYMQHHLSQSSVTLFLPCLTALVRSPAVYLWIIEAAVSCSQPESHKPSGLMQGPLSFLLGAVRAHTAASGGRQREHRRRGAALRGGRRRQRSGRLGRATALQSCGRQGFGFRV